MAIELNLRLNILATQNELNLRIGDNIGTTGEEPRTTGAAAPKPLSNIADAMPDASEPVIREPEDNPPPRASSSLAGLRPPESNVRMTSLRDLATSLQRRVALPEGQMPAARLPRETEAPRTGEPARRTAPEETGEGRVAAAKDEADEASFRDSLASVMRRVPTPASSTVATDGFSQSPAAPDDSAAKSEIDSDTSRSSTPRAPVEASTADGGTRDAGHSAPPDASADRWAPPELRQGSKEGLPVGIANDDGAEALLPARAADLRARAADSVSSNVSLATSAEPGASPAKEASPANEALGQATADHGARTVATSDTAALADKLFSVALTTADGQAQPERAGVIASFILNAAMIPGWPPPRPIEGPPLQVLAGLVTVSKDLTEADKELLLFLANMGFSRKHLKRLLRKLEVAKNKSKLLQSLTLFATNVASAAKALAEELADLLEDEDEERPAMARTPAGRARLDLR